VVASTDGTIRVFDHNGAEVPPCSGVRFSVFTSNATNSSPVVADINGDGLNDIVIGDENGQLTAISGTGAILPGFPIQLDAEVKGTPALCDCDGDGKTEILVEGYDKNMYMWDYDNTFSPGQLPPWPQFHHDARRTGLATNFPFVGVNDPVPTRPGSKVELALMGSNPTRSGAVLRYAVPSASVGSSIDLAVFDLGGRRVRTLMNGLARPGRQYAEWDLMDANGNRAGAGVYFLRFVVGGEALSQKLVVLH
jgi:hypothetical protein